MTELGPGTLRLNGVVVAHVASLAVTVGTHCAGCGKYREHRRGRWLCLPCIVVPSRDKDIEALRQEYL